MVEQILKIYDAAYAIRHMCLRYFNTAGAEPAMAAVFPLEK